MSEKSVRARRTARGGGAETRVPPSGKKSYSPPRLESYGDLRTLTLGGSPGIGDSGAAFTEQLPI